jgi:hypothetical protein
VSAGSPKSFALNAIRRAICKRIVLTKRGEQEEMEEDHTRGEAREMVATEDRIDFMGS